MTCDDAHLCEPPPAIPLPPTHLKCHGDDEDILISTLPPFLSRDTESADDECENVDSGQLPVSATRKRAAEETPESLCGTPPNKLLSLSEGRQSDTTCETPNDGDNTTEDPAVPDEIGCDKCELDRSYADKELADECESISTVTTSIDSDHLDASVSSEEASPQQPAPLTFSRHQSLIIFDWDDTLMPSTWLAENRITLEESSVVPDDVRVHLDIIAEGSRKILETASKLGTVVIVTNAESGWVKLSCSKFMPTLSPHLDRYRVVSARSKYEGENCSTPLSWKVSAFRDEVHFHYQTSQERRNIMSFGDAAHERTALLGICSTLAREYPITAKSIKFIERPSIGDLEKEHELILSCVEQLVLHDGDLDFCIKPLVETPPQDNSQNPGECMTHGNPTMDRPQCDNAGSMEPDSISASTDNPSVPNPELHHEDLDMEMGGDLTCAGDENCPPF